MMMRWVGGEKVGKMDKQDDGVQASSFLGKRTCAVGGLQAYFIRIPKRAGYQGSRQYFGAMQRHGS